ncbi:magnesium chelatase subunit D [Hydrogenophaga sp.]|uniref:magnesium chelatase subunit D n=1 Tax=Hydrogenophaga sp. TaxID=1904254 RepID=UPI002731776D|nr:magnesium chelatase subunit D [Hydrogenophaga sp.]MDP2072727.1 magnesium chelatase subunit D [Hydrogenophaga sp.]MDZ4281418.1 magnesium chelatase subunit D [Hydrogenophaga sp.]MDZ4400123.1 magnesium chelatase subunit D [Hydrogenophaga sp.]
MLDAFSSPVPNADAALVAALLAVDPAGLGGVALRATAGPLRDAWLTLLREGLPASTPMHRVPLHATDSALLGGLDLAATLHAGRPVAQQGLLARCDGGVLLLAMAERVGAGVASQLAAVLDTQVVALERDGLTQRRPARVALVALDEGDGEEEQMPATLLDRVAFHLPLQAAGSDDDAPVDWTRAEIAEARARLSQVVVPEEVVKALCAASLVWGVNSMRAPLLAVRVARAAAALSGMDEAEEVHASLAARLVLAPRATRVPAPPAEEADDTPPPPTDAQEPTPDEDDAQDAPPPEAPQDEPDHTPDEEEAPGALDDRLIEAVRAAIPPGLLAALQMGQARQARAAAAGRSGELMKNQNRGRPVGTRRAEPRSGARLHILETLRAAAPWQRLRQQKADGPKRIQVRREDFHVVRFRQRRPTTTLFVVDASGSAALHRLAEAKGAVELLLAECYVRRDKVAVLAFRGDGCELLLPPTRSLARAKRSLAALPGGGGTPLAAGIEAARELAAQIGRAGETPIVVMLTDGRANVARDGRHGRARATEDALEAADAFRLAGLSALLIDTSSQPGEASRVMAERMGAACVPLPHAGAAGLSQAVRLATLPGTR